MYRYYVCCSRFIFNTFLFYFYFLLFLWLFLLHLHMFLLWLINLRFVFRFLEICFQFCLVFDLISTCFRRLFLDLFSTFRFLFIVFSQSALFYSLSNLQLLLWHFWLNLFFDFVFWKLVSNFFEIFRFIIELFREWHYIDLIRYNESRKRWVF